MSKIKVLDKNLNLGWNVGDEVELSHDQNLKELLDKGQVEVVELSDEDKEVLFPKKVEVKVKKVVKKKK